MKLFCCALLLSFASLAHADDIHDILTVNLIMGSCALDNYCRADPGSAGSQASAFADFSLQNLPWSFALITGFTNNWSDDTGYIANFGYGGTFNMTGPDGLTLHGVITSGQAMGQQSGWLVEVNYFGLWSNGLYGVGSAEVTINDGGQEGVAYLNSQVAPEPSTFLMLGTGIVGMWGYRRKLS